MRPGEVKRGFGRGTAPGATRRFAGSTWRSCPGGTSDSSPPLQWWENAPLSPYPVPEGRLKRGLGWGLSRPSGTRGDNGPPLIPPLKRWAIVSRP